MLSKLGDDLVLESIDFHMMALHELRNLFAAVKESGITPTEGPRVQRSRLYYYESQSLKDAHPNLSWGIRDVRVGAGSPVVYILLERGGFGLGPLRGTIAHLAWDVGTNGRKEPWKLTSSELSAPAWVTQSPGVRMGKQYLEARFTELPADIVAKIVAQFLALNE